MTTSLGLYGTAALLPLPMPMPIAVRAMPWIVVVPAAPDLPISDDDADEYEAQCGYEEDT